MVFSGRKRRSAGCVSIVAIALLAACGGGDGSGPGSGQPGFPDLGSGGGSESVRLTWTAPTEQVDGACLTEPVSEYRISYGNSPGLYVRTESADLSQVDCAAVGRDQCGDVLECSVQLTGLEPAPWYIAVQAVDGLGNVSEYSNEALWPGPS